MPTNLEFEREFENLFKQHHADLCRMAYRKVFDIQVAEDLVQEVFLHLWKNQKSFQTISNPRAYLRTSVINKCHDHNRKLLKMKTDFKESSTLYLVSKDVNKETELLTDELEARILKAIETLPSQCKLVFKLSRFSKMSYHDIAESLDVSQKAVEKQMTKALKHLRSVVFKT